MASIECSSHELSSWEAVDQKSRLCLLSLKR
jgi:hypothetical protein